MDSEDQILLLEPRSLFDPAIIGILERCGQPPCACYDRAILLDILTEEGRSCQEAQQYIDERITGCWLGEGTWAVLERIPPDLIRKED